jgi:hypothetical protein
MLVTRDQIRAMWAVYETKCSNAAGSGMATRSRMQTLNFLGLREIFAFLMPCLGFPHQQV